ncbi:hypothetical protein MKX68_24940 [Paenibacillus sp. FSL M8-0212]|uniref:hypothetical protein n=1 Tax=Paenibacillus sp. FSL M8-0212 TaxID=2921618 RepID=UPI0030F928FE
MMVLVVRAKFRAQIDGKWQDIELTSALASLTAKKKNTDKKRNSDFTDFRFCMYATKIHFIHASVWLTGVD